MDWLPRTRANSVTSVECARAIFIIFEQFLKQGDLLFVNFMVELHYFLSQMMITWDTYDHTVDQNFVRSFSCRSCSQDFDSLICCMCVSKREFKSPASVRDG